MKKSREELTRIHKEKCKELKKIRAQIAADLGVDLKQSECTYEGYCSGTCPKCKSEEMKLNLAIMKQQMESADMKRKVAAAGLTTAAALSLSGCNIADTQNWEATEGVLPAPTTMSSEVLDGDVEYIDESEPNSQSDISGSDIEGKLVVPESSTEWDLAGGIALLEESTEENMNE